MPAEKKIWVFDGSIAQYSTNYLSSTHGGVGCTGCHGGDNGASTRAAAHSGSWQAIPGADKCQGCHAAIAASSENSLHTNLGGYVEVLSDRGVSFADGSASKTRFDAQCTKCHLANSETKAACGFCHVSVPTTAGGGFLNGHNFRKTPDMDRNCTACHGSRVKDEFYGQNGALVTRNGLGLPAPKRDVHFAKTQELNGTGLPKGCTFCHGGSEMHGGGAPAPVGTGDRYSVSESPSCDAAACHPSLTNSNTLHTGAHLAAMSCQSCHSQPYKNCFGCHTDIDTAATGLPFYRINEGDPTLATRAAGSAPDALMTFRIGRNPRLDKPYKFAVLRHAPVDKDTFRYGEADPLDGLIPGVTALPTWKYATPHNVQTNSAESFLNAKNCTSCHDATGYQAYWLTDPLQDAEGWLEAPYQADEDAANAGVKQATPMKFDTSN